MNITAMLDRMAWNSASMENDLGRLNRILASLRASLLRVDAQEEVRAQYDAFWGYVAGRNLYMAVLLLKQCEKLYGTEDRCTRCGFTAVHEGIKPYVAEDAPHAAWRMLAEVELRTDCHIATYTRDILKNGRLRDYLKFLQLSADFDNSAVFYLQSCCLQDYAFKRKVFKELLALKWRISAAESVHLPLLAQAVARNVQWNDIFTLINLIDLCDDLKMTQPGGMTCGEWKAYLLTQRPPHATILYRKILKREGVAPEEILREIYGFTFWATGRREDLINNYVYFSYAISAFPDRYETYAHCFDNDDEATQKDSAGLDLTEEDERAGLPGDDPSRGLNYLLIDKPFVALIRGNPAMIQDFIRRVGRLSLYHASKSLQYRKNQTWVVNNFLQDYKNYIVEFSREHTPQEVLDLYMNSPLKGMVDFSYVVRLLFQPPFGFRDLTEVLDGCILRGNLLRDPAADAGDAYRVTLSNACSSYRFPIHRSWVEAHRDTLETEFTGDRAVYFKIMSVNSHGMIFAYDLAPTPQPERRQEAERVNIKAIKNANALIHGMLPYPKGAAPEAVRLFVTAMICDGSGRLLLDGGGAAGSLPGTLPYMPVFPRETAAHALKRMLKNFAGMQLDATPAPVGVRHFCAADNRRYSLLLYKLTPPPADPADAAAAPAKSATWCDIARFRFAADDEISENILDAFDTPWSETAFLLDKDFILQSMNW